MIPNLGLIRTALATGGAKCGCWSPAAVARGSGNRRAYSTVAAPESGSAYLRDFDKHGSAGTSPWLDLATRVNALLETVGSVYRSSLLAALGAVVGKPASEEINKLLVEHLRIRCSIRLSGGMREGGTEAADDVTERFIRW